MLTLKNLIFICGVLIASMLVATASSADKIILIDGSVETSDRIWESEHHIHFILNGTQAVEIRYAKEIVTRIEREIPVGEAAIKNSVKHTGASEVKVDVSGKNEHHKASVDGQGPPKVRNQSHEAHQQLVKENRGLSFYDPRRPMRYWAMRNSKHKELTSALDAMAKRYGRSANWVGVHMGQENDLGKIHQNLGQQVRSEILSSGKPMSFNTDRGNRERSLPEAAIELNHGEKEGSRSTPSFRPQVGTGIRFYDPRRVEKYWSGQASRHHTLKEALNALAQNYGVTPSWIESHMGDTNDLSTIHHTIQKNLKLE